MKKLNLNSIVKVKLTDYGKDIFYHQYDSLNKRVLANGGNPIKPRYPDVDEDGFSKFQLWDFMHVYGHTFILGSNDMVIQPLDIFIEEKDLEETEKYGALKHARWKDDRCTNCGEHAVYAHGDAGSMFSPEPYGYYRHTPYCPNCGAKMDLKK